MFHIFGAKMVFFNNIYLRTLRGSRRHLLWQSWLFVFRLVNRPKIFEILKIRLSITFSSLLLCIILEFEQNMKKPLDYHPPTHPPILPDNNEFRLRKRHLYANVSETAIIVHQYHIKWRDRQVNPIRSVRASPRGTKVYEVSKKANIHFFKPIFD